MQYVSDFTPPAFRWLYQKNYGLVVWPVESFDSDQHFDKILDLGMDEDDIQTVQTGYIYDNGIGSHTYGLPDALVKQWIEDNPNEFNKPKPPRADPPSDYYRPEVYSPFTSATQDEQLFDTTDYTTAQYPMGIVPRIIQVDTDDTSMGYHGGGLTGMFFPRTKNLYVATQEAYHLDLVDELERQDSMAGYIGGGADVIPFRVGPSGQVNLYEHMIKPRYKRYMKAIRDTVTAMWPELETQAYFGEEDYYEEESEYPSEERSAKKLANPFVAGRYIYDKQDDKLYTSEGEEGHWGIAQRHNIDYAEERWEGPGSQFEFGYIHQLDDGQLACWPVTDFYREGPMSDRPTDLLLGSGFTPWPRVSSASANYICVFVYDGTDGNLYLGSEGETHYDLLYDNVAEEDYSSGFVLGWVFDNNGYKAVLDSIEYAEVVDPEYKADALEALSGHYRGIVEAPSSQLFRQKQINNVMGEDMKYEEYEDYEDEHYGATNGQGFLIGGPDPSDLGLEATYAYNATTEELYAVWGFDLHPYMLANRIEDDDFQWTYDDDYECGRIYRDKTGIAENGDVINYWVDHYSVEQDWGLSASTVKEADAAITVWLGQEIVEYEFTVNDYNEYGPGGSLLQNS